MKTLVQTLALGLALIGSEASAQVLLTEIQPNPTGSDFAEWVELQNTGATPVDVGGWTINELTGATESTMWAFPTGTILAADQVVVVTRQAATFKQRSAVEWSNYPPDFELALGNDDAMTPNMTGGPNWNLEDNQDAVILRDGLGAYIDGVEYGADSTLVPGPPVRFWPTMSTQSEGISIQRVDTQFGTSQDDWTVTQMTDAGIGYQTGIGTPPMVIAQGHAPVGFTFGQDVTLTATVTDLEGVASVTFHVAIATTVDGPADGAYVAVTGTRGSNIYWSATGPAGNLAAGLMFDDPASFHDRYLRWYIEATDIRGAVVILPKGATSEASNAAFYWENVLPATAVATIAEARSQDGQGVLDYEGHSVRVEGVATTDDTAFNDVEFNFFLSDPANLDAIFVQDNVFNPVRIDIGDQVRVIGKIGELAGQRMIGEDTRMGQARFRGYELVVQKLGTTMAPEVVVSLATIAANAEAYEGQLIVVPNVEMVEGPGGEPIPATFPQNMPAWVSDGTRQEIFIAAATGLPGMATPTESFTLRGIVTEYFGGYRFQPRGMMDILPAMPDVDAGVVDSGADPDSGTVDPNRDAGSTNPGRDAGVTQPVRDGGVGGTGGTDKKDGCGCEATTARGSAWSLLALVGVFFALRRRR